MLHQALYQRRSLLAVLPVMLHPGGHVSSCQLFSDPSSIEVGSDKSYGNHHGKYGLNRKTKMEALYGPRDLGGADFRHLHIQQGIAQTTYFLRHWRCQSSVGKLLKCTLAWLQFSVGVSFPVLERADVPLPHLESKWIASLRTFKASIGASIQLDNPCVPRPDHRFEFFA
jgi:hypothetical protein